MAKLTQEQVEHIAKLSKLKLTQEEKEKYCEQLSSVLDYVEELKEVDTKDIEATSSVTGLFNITAKDQIEDSGIDHKDIEFNAPEFKNGHFIVPGIFDNE